MKNRLALLLGCLVLFASRPAWSQKPAADPAKPAATQTPASPPSHAEPAPAQPSHSPSPSRPESPNTGETRHPNPPTANPEHLPKAPKANPVKPEKADQPRNVSLRNSRKIGKSTLTSKAAQASGQQAIVTEMPVVFWPSPMTIHQGESLAGALAGASASVPGTFIYAPALSYVPPQGNCDVVIQFSPADPIHYLSASATVVVTVL